MNYKVEIDTKAVASRFSGKCMSAQKWLDNEVLKDCDEYVPFRTGNLRNSGIRGTKLGSGKVVYNAPYAASCYYGKKKFLKDKHPKACAQWFEKAKKVNKDKWIAGAEKKVTEESK